MYDINFFKRSSDIKKKTTGRLFSKIEVEDISAELDIIIDRNPFICNIETTNYCNMKCVFCARTMYMERKNIWINDDLFEKMLDKVVTYDHQKLNNGIYGNYGSMFISDSIFSTEIKYQDSPLSFDDVPQQGSPAYLELDYKNNTRCLIGLYINASSGATIEKGLVWVSPKENWHKIYVNLTETLTESVGAESFSLFIRMYRDFELEENKIDFDNIRIIHYQK